MSDSVQLQSLKDIIYQTETSLIHVEFICLFINTRLSVVVDTIQWVRWSFHLCLFSCDISNRCCNKFKQ